MFDLDQFIADCRAALAADKSHKNVREIVARAVCDYFTLGSVILGSMISVYPRRWAGAP